MNSTQGMDITEEQLLQRSIKHLHGPEEVSYGEDELVVVCLVRDGRPYIKSFVEHYLSLGVKHIAFLDNGSTDGTIEALQNYENVTVLQTELSFKEYKNQMRQYLIARFGRRDRWCLCVDIDELFDYPYSDVIRLSSFLGYLNSKSYTAVVAQMLDMFQEEYLTGRASNVDEPLKELHRFYDVSNISRRSPKESTLFRSNTFDSDEIERFSGGIREILFGYKSLLSKFPLVFLDGRVQPFDGGSHMVDNARVADLTCVLFHYKFLEGYFHGQVAQAVREENYARNSAKYKMYKKVLDSSPTLQVRQDTARKLEDVNELLENGFLVVSEDYLSWVNAEEEKSVLEQAPQSKTAQLTEAFLKPRRQERAKRQERARTFRLRRLEQQLRDRDRELKEATRELQKTQRQVLRLERQLESMQASRAWTLVKVLRRIKAGVSNPLRRSSS